LEPYPYRIPLRSDGGQTKAMDEKCRCLAGPLSVRPKTASKDAGYLNLLCALRDPDG